MDKTVENNNLDSLENSSNTEYENNMAIFEDIRLPIKKYEEIIKEINLLSDDLPNIKIEKQKDMDKIERKVSNLLSLYRELNNNYLIFFNKSIVDVKKNIKL